jgi:hypothetical protein
VLVPAHFTIKVSRAEPRGKDGRDLGLGLLELRRVRGRRDLEVAAVAAVVAVGEEKRLVRGQAVVDARGLPRVVLGVGKERRRRARGLGAAVLGVERPRGRRAGPRGGHAKDLGALADEGLERQQARADRLGLRRGLQVVELRALLPPPGAGHVGAVDGVLEAVGVVLLCLGFREREAHNPPTSNPMSPHTQINSGNDVDRTRGGKSGSAKSRVADSRLG